MMPTLLAEKKKWTYEEYLQLGEEIHGEVIEGELSMTPAPNLEHQDISRNLELAMAHHIQAKGCGRIFYAPTDVVFDKENIVQPDLVFVATPNFKILRKRGIKGNPDLVVEILSPSSLVQDRYTKKQLYEKFAVPEYWIVDPANKSIEVLCLEKGQYQPFSFACANGVIKSKVIPDLEIEVSSIMVDEYEE